MDDLTEFTFETDKGPRVLVLDDHAIKLLQSALTQIGKVPGRPISEARSWRDDILSGRKKVPPLLYNRFHKMMQKRLGGSPVRIEVEGEMVALTEGGTARGRGKAVRGKAKSLSIEDQIKSKRRQRLKDEKEGRAYRDFLPVTAGATIGRGKGDPTSNIFAVGKHRGTIYVVEEISAPTPLPARLPSTRAGKARAQEAAVAPYIWQARVLSHPWTRMTRGGFVERSGPGGAATSGLAGLYRVGELTKAEFPTFTGKNGWQGAKRDVENAIDRSYEYRVEVGSIPPELERYVKEEIEKIRKGGRTPSLAPRTRRGTSGTVRRRVGGRAAPVKKKNPKKKTKKKAKKKTKKRSSRNPKNPTIEVHQEMGEGFLAESEKLWDSYCKTRSSKTLLDAYRVLELACQEFKYTGDQKRQKQADDGIRAARSEILSCITRKTKKKPSKKKAKKKAKRSVKKAGKKSAKK